MRWTCPKCGKKLDVSNEQLIANDGVIICPQCLLQAHQPIPKARVTTRGQAKSSASSSPKRTQPSISFDAETPPAYHSTTPPPHQPRMKPASTSYRYTGLGSDSSSNPTPPKRKTTGKKKSRKKKNQGITAWGCLGRTIVFTLVLFAAYVFFGLLLESIQ